MAARPAYWRWRRDQEDEVSDVDEEEVIIVLQHMARQRLDPGEDSD